MLIRLGSRGCEGDRPGTKGAEKLARHLGDRARIAKVPCTTTPIPKGWDISDTLNAGCTIAEIHAAAKQAIKLPPEPSSDKKLRLNYEECMEQIEQILELEDTARQLWELNQLAKRADLSSA